MDKVTRGLLILVGTFFMVLLVGYCSRDKGGGHANTPEPPSCTDLDARIMAKYNVEGNLKNPDEADFSNTATWEVQREGEVFTVTGQVTATNSFNAKIKQTFVARLKCAPDGWHNGSVIFQ